MIRLWLVSYDISDDRARRAVDLALQRYGERVQRSVFECFLRPEELSRLRAELVTMIDPETDSIRYYPLCAWCEGRIAWLGHGRRAQDRAFWVI